MINESTITVFQTVITIKAFFQFWNTDKAGLSISIVNSFGIIPDAMDAVALVSALHNPTLILSRNFNAAIESEIERAPFVKTIKQSNSPSEINMFALKKKTSNYGK